MGAPCSKMADRDVLPLQRRNPNANKTKQQLQRNAPNPLVDPCCPVHGTHAHTHPPTTEAAPAPASSRRLQQNGVPLSPVSTSFFTPVATGLLALQTPAGRPCGIPTEEELLQQPASAYLRAKRGGIRKTGLQLLRPTQAYVVGQPATLKVEIRNAQPRPLDGAMLLLLDNGYFAEASLALPEVGAGQTVVVEVAARPKRSTFTLKDLKGELELRVMRDIELVMAQTFLLDALDFAGDLMPLVVPEGAATATAGGEERFLNLYVLGAKNSGKTAFIQTLASALAQSPPPTAGGDNAAPLQPTTELDRVNVAKLVAGQEGRFARPLNFRVFDLWGTDAAFTTEELPHILAGKAPLGFSVSHSTAALPVEDRADLLATLPQRAADGALFFVGAGDMDDATKMEVLKLAFEAAKAALGGHAPLVVLGRGDVVEGKLLAEPLNWSSKKIATLRKRLATAFGVSWAQTFVAVPYAALPLKPAATVPMSVRSNSMTTQPATADAPLDGSVRNFDVDRLALIIAHAALEAARLKAEGKAPLQAQPASMLPPPPKSVHTPASVPSTRVSSVRRQPTVDLSTMDGSFSSNFAHFPVPKSAASKIVTDTPISAIGVEKSEAEAP